MDAFSDESAWQSDVTHDDEEWHRIHGPVTILLDELGQIVDCCQGSERLFGFRRSELENQQISMLFPQLSKFRLWSNGHIDSLLDYLCHCGAAFLTRDRYGHTFKSELHFVELVNQGAMRTIRLIVSPFIGENDELYTFTS
jgi:hypothetical protein